MKEKKAEHSKEEDKGDQKDDAKIEEIAKEIKKAKDDINLFSDTIKDLEKMDKLEEGSEEDEPKPK